MSSKTEVKDPIVEEADREAEDEDVPGADDLPDGIDPASLETIGGWRVHPAASVFPLNPPNEQRKLVESIRQDGLLHPIAVWRDLLLDGRNRTAGCEEAGVEPRVEVLDPEIDPVAYVIRANLRRRHLSRSQLAICAARLSNLPPGRPGAGQDCPVSVKQAAELVAVSPRLVKAARAVERRGTPRLRRAVETGDLTVTRAAGFARAGSQKQDELLERAASRANRAEREAIFAAAAKDLAAWSADGQPGPEPEEEVRRTARQRCLRRLASLVQEARDPDEEYRAVVGELCRLVGLGQPVDEEASDDRERSSPAQVDEEPPEDEEPEAPSEESAA